MVTFRQIDARKQMKQSTDPPSLNFKFDIGMCTVAFIGSLLAMKSLAVIDFYSIAFFNRSSYKDTEKNNAMNLLCLIVEVQRIILILQKKTYMMLYNFYLYCKQKAVSVFRLVFDV